MHKPLVSIIVPCFNEEAALPVFFPALLAVTAGMGEARFEYIFVNDGSRDNTLERLRQLAREHDGVRYLSFSRNFGKEAAMLAGLEAARGDFVGIMDADLQDPPELLPQLLQAVTHEGYHCAAVRRTTRTGEPPIRSFFARRFYRVMTRLCKFEVVDGARDFRLMSRRMTDAVLALGERSRFSKGLFAWVGFETKWIECENRERAAGETKWSFWGLLFYAMDGIISFSAFPLALSSLLGLVFCACAFVAIVFVVVRQLVWGGSAFGWSSLVCILLLLSGIQLFSIGILGQYLAKAFTEVKHRPHFIIGEQGGHHDGAE